MKKYLIVLFLFNSYLIQAQENLWGGYYKINIDSTIVRLKKEVIKIDNFEYKDYMEKIIIINEANRLLDNPYSKINRFLDFKNYKKNQLEDKNIKKLFKKFKTENLKFMRISTININKKYYVIINNLTADYFENKIRILQKGSVAMAIFNYDNEKFDWKFEKLEMGNW